MMNNESRKKALLKEDRWSRTYELYNGDRLTESKFDTDDTSISLDEITKMWPTLDQSEKVSFVGAFKHKPQFSSEDEKILEFVMKNGNEILWVNLGQCLTYHSNKKLILDFLSQRMRSDFRPRANFCQALGALGDQSAIPVLVEEYQNDQAAINAAGAAADRFVLMDFLACCAALRSLGAPGDYAADIRQYLNHSDQGIRRSAERKLDLL
jgi:hypothetical protein